MTRSLDKGNSKESRQVFLEDLMSLREHVKMRGFDNKACRDSSVILFRWLFDRRPLLLNLARGFGVQLWLPVKSDEANRYDDFIQSIDQTAVQSGSYGSGAGFGFKWGTLDEFASDAAMSINMEPVSNRDFVCFVRNKLGGSHLDEHNRRHWQKLLKAFSDSSLPGGTNAINFQMFKMSEGILNAVEVSRMEFYCKGVLRQ